MNVRRGVVTATILSIIVTTSCAPLPAQHSPQAIDRSKVSELFPTSTTAVDRPAEKGVVCFFSQAEGSDDAALDCGARPLERLSNRTLIDALATGPTKEQNAMGLTTYVPPNTRLLGAEFARDDNNVLIINLSSEINDVANPNLTLAYRQIVETLTNKFNRRGADAIRVKVEGKPTKIQTDQGQLKQADTSDFNPSDTTSTSP